MFVTVLPEFTQQENCPPNTPYLNPMDHLLVGSVATDGISSKISAIDGLECVIIDCWTQLSQDTPKRATWKKTDDGAHDEFRLD